MRIHFFKKIFFIVIIAFFSFLLLESAIRIYYFLKVNRDYEETILDTLPMVVFNANRIFELKSNYHQIYKSSEFQITLQTNSDALRDIEHSISKPKDVYRILALGDSFTFGWGVEQNDTWWKFLENKLNNEDLKYKYEAINLGVWMYTYDQQFLRLKEKGLKYQPDLVIQGIYWPHLRTISTHKWIKNNENIIQITDPTIYVNKDNLLKTKDKNSFIAFLKRYSKFFNLIIGKIQVLSLKDELITSDLVLLKENSKKEYLEVWQKTLESIRQTKKFLDKEGIDYLIFLIPRDVQVSKKEWTPLYEESMNEQLYQDTIPQKIFTDFAFVQNIPIINLLPAFRERYSSELYFLTDPHWQKEGHRLAAEEIYQFIKNSFETTNNHQ